MRSESSCDWTQAMDAELLRLGKTDMRFVRIAECLNAKFGTALTKNAVIGRHRRLTQSARTGVDFWKPEVDKALRAAHAEGLTSRGVADRLTCQFGVRYSHQRVERQIRLLGLASLKRPPRFATGAKTAPKPKPPEIAKPAAAPAPKPQRVKVFGGPELIPAKPVTLAVRRRHQCAWPLNDGNPFLFCGASKMQRQSLDEPEYAYCPHHQWRSIGQDAARRKLMERLA